jgi:UDP-glucose:(heptosyl)LPS alpha-1,3-glucosyltransferase
LKPLRRSKIIQLRFVFLIFKVFPYGGVQRDMLRIAADLIGLGHKVHILTGEWRGDAPPAGVTHEVLPTHGWLNHLRHANLITSMQTRLAQSQFDFVVGFNRMPLLDAYFAADPCFVAREVSPLYTLMPRYQFFANAEQAVFGWQSHADILLLTERERAIFQRYYATPDARFHLIPPNLPLAKFAGLDKIACRQYLRDVFHLPQTARIVLTVGSAYIRKGVDRAMLGVASLPTDMRNNTWMIALGEHESSSTFNQDAKKLGLAKQCILAGGRDDVAKLMLGADVLAHPARSELAGIVLMEALVAQLPVIVTDVCGYAPHIAASGGGVVLASPFNQEAFNRALSKILQPTFEYPANQVDEYMHSLQQQSELTREAQTLAQLALQKEHTAWVRVNDVTLPSTLLPHLQGDVFEACMQLQGKLFRNVPGRKTMRVTLNIANKGVDEVKKSYFIKQHFGVGWGEILKNLLSLKLPILGAMIEVRAIQKLSQLGIATTPLVAYGQRGCNPANLQSFVITEDLGDIISLEEMLMGSQAYPIPEESKRLMLKAVADIASKLHNAGLCHRDFYLCHFVLSRQNALANQYDLHLIDLHRMLQSQSPNSDAVMKDIAGLYFSMLQNGLDTQDLSIFKQHYLPQTAAFWEKVEARANKLLAKFNSAKFQKRLAKEKSAIN